MKTTKYLAAFHVHSDWSYDGKWPLETLAAKFAQKGYRVLMMSEHDRGFTQSRFRDYAAACACASSDRILVVPGIEYSDAKNLIHILVWGPVPFIGEGLSTSRILHAVIAANGVAVLAHPSRLNAWQSFDATWSARLLGVELWNRKYDGWMPSGIAPELIKTIGGMAFVGLDFHDRRQLFPLAMALDLESSLTEEAVLRCLKSRRCYPCAWGTGLHEGLLSTVIPYLGVAEWSRRHMARLYRRLRRRSSAQ